MATEIAVLNVRIDPNPRKSDVAVNDMRFPRAFSVEIRSAKNAGKYGALTTVDLCCAPLTRDLTYEIEGDLVAPYGVRAHIKALIGETGYSTQVWLNGEPVNHIEIVVKATREGTLVKLTHLTADRQVVVLDGYLVPAPQRAN